MLPISLKLDKNQKIKVGKKFANGGPIGSIFGLWSFLTATNYITKFDCKPQRMKHSFHTKSIKFTTLVFERYPGGIFNQAYFVLDAFVCLNTISIPIFMKMY